MIIYKLPSQDINNFSDFQYADEISKREFTHDFLKDAKAFNEDVNACFLILKKGLWMSNGAIVLLLALQFMEVLPKWIPGCFLAVYIDYFYEKRLPMVSAKLDTFMQSMEATPSRFLDTAFSEHILGCCAVVWFFGSLLTGEWELFAMATSFCTIFALIYEISDYRKNLEKSLNAYKKCGEKLVNELRVAS